MRITVVTVTYGKRWHLLQQTLRAAFDEGAHDAIVVDNAALEDVPRYVARSFPGRARTLRLPDNVGSAGGYCTGIKAAISGGADFILLLDDDNCLESGSLSRLKEAFQLLLQRDALDGLCVLGLRPDQMPKLVRGWPYDGIGESGNTFFGFHIKDLPIKLWRRVLTHSRIRRNGDGECDRPICLQTAPYGGMLFHSSLIGRFGYPDARFVLYVDDTEFSYRISRDGGAIWLIPSARITDLERSWQVSDRNANAFEIWLCHGSAKHAYYTARNWAYFQCYCREHSSLLKINRQVFLAILWMVAVLRRKLDRRDLLAFAIKDGERGCLGINPAFPLGS